jgi:hypothetical protein
VGKNALSFAHHGEPRWWQQRTFAASNDGGQENPLPTLRCSRHFSIKIKFHFFKLQPNTTTPMHLLNLRRFIAAVLTTAATLAAADPGMLRIATEPGDAQIFINGQRKGNSPEQEGQTFAVKLPQGDYTVEAKKSDGSDYYAKKSVYVSNDSLQTVNLKLEKVAKPYGNAANGSVTIAGREWLRCSVGQSWNGSTCEGEALKYTFEQAQQTAATFNATGYGGKRDWRVPTVRELQSLRVCSTGFVSEKRDLQDGGEPVSKYCNDNSSKPTIDQNTFPKTPDSWFWTSSPYAGYSYGAWVVNFDDGNVYDGYRGSANPVRLVR